MIVGKKTSIRRDCDIGRKNASSLPFREVGKKTSIRRDCDNNLSTSILIAIIM